MIKTVSQLNKGDQLILEDQVVTILNVGEDKVSGQMVIFWDSWENQSFRLPLSQNVEIR